MLTIVFSLYFLSTMAMLVKKRKLAIALIIIALLYAIFILWFHATDKLGIRL